MPRSDTPDEDDYAGPDRREATSFVEVELIFERLLREHEGREAARTARLIEALKAEAFPDGAPAHKMAHQAMIDAAKSQADFWNGLRADIAKKSIFGILRILGILLLVGLGAKFGVAPGVWGWLTK